MFFFICFNTSARVARREVENLNELKNIHTKVKEFVTLSVCLSVCLSLSILSPITSRLAFLHDPGHHPDSGIWIADTLSAETKKQFQTCLHLWMPELFLSASFYPFCLKISHFCCLFTNTYPGSHLQGVWNLRLKFHHYWIHFTLTFFFFTRYVSRAYFRFWRRVKVDLLPFFAIFSKKLQLQRTLN